MRRGQAQVRTLPAARPGLQVWHRAELDENTAACSVPRQLCTAARPPSSQCQLHQHGPGVPPVANVSKLSRPRAQRALDRRGCGAVHRPTQNVARVPFQPLRPQYVQVALVLREHGHGQRVSVHHCAAVQELHRAEPRRFAELLLAVRPVQRRRHQRAAPDPGHVRPLEPRDPRGTDHHHHDSVRGRDRKHQQKLGQPHEGGVSGVLVAAAGAGAQLQGAHVCVPLFFAALRSASVHVKRRRSGATARLMPLAGH
ncbi:hypothetical protein KL920_005208 [Ogataea angusta]|nr:hypothetical protein KL920_005208 [Ogataea angusta]